MSIAASVRWIGNSAFRDCSLLPSVAVPDGVIVLGAGAFSYCSSLTSISFPSSLTSIGSSPFTGCYRLESLEVHPSNPRYESRDDVLFDKEKHSLVRCALAKAGNYYVPSDISSIGFSSFSGCRNLISVFIPDTVTSIEGSAFDGCFGLK